MAIRGSLKEASLPDVLQLLAMGKKSGCLSVAHRTSFGYIYFDKGRISYASVVNRRDRIGDLLVKSNVIADRRTESPSMSDWLDFGAAPSAGDRAPDVDLRAEHGPKRLFELLRGTKHALLLFDGAAATEEGYKNLATIARVVAERHGRTLATHVLVPRADRPSALGDAVSVIADPHGAAHRRYGAGSECLFLVRPDGYVGYRSQPALLDPLMEHLGRILL